MTLPKYALFNADNALKKQNENVQLIEMTFASFSFSLEKSTIDIGRKFWMIWDFTVALCFDVES